MRLIQSIALSMAVACSMTILSCSEDKVENGHNEIVFSGNIIGNGDQEFEITGDQVIKKGVYTLKGWCYVNEGATLTIEPGTVIKGDKQTKAAIIVERGGRLIAQGTVQEPIVMTSSAAPGSRKPGDWGGLIICGNAKNNRTNMPIEGGPRSQHGGNNDSDNSGIVSYVRIEFAGYPLQTDQEINGFTLGSVGSGTQIDHVQVSYSNDDSYEWFGGTVNAKYLVSYHGWDDDFDTDNGYNGKLQFLLAVRNPRIADTSWSNSFESDNNADGSTSAPYTSPTFSNVTMVGPIGQDPAFVNNTSYVTGGSMNPNNGSKLGVFQSAMQVRRNSKLSCFNTVAIGYPVGLMLDNHKGTSQQWATDGELKLKNLVFAGMTVIGSDVNQSLKDSLSTNGKDFVKPLQQSFSHTFFAEQGNTSFAAISEVGLKQPNSLLAETNYGPVAGSVLTQQNNLFTDSRLTDNFFDKVDYIGAFKSDSDSDNWTKGWTEFDPQNKTY